MENLNNLKSMELQYRCSAVKFVNLFSELSYKYYLLPSFVEFVVKLLADALVITVG